jgi:aspartate-semialdehyde dehydrogenase
MVVALKPLHDRARIKRVVVATYQSVSGTGKEAIDELWNQTKGIYVPGQEVAPRLPQADRLQRDPTYRRLP